MKTPEYYTSTEMLRAAFEFRQAELWDSLRDNHIFGVTLPDGRIGYCSVMGNAGTYFGLGLYRGEEGLSGFLRMIYQPQDEVDAMAEALIYDVINCNFSQANDMNFGIKEPVRAFAKETGYTIKRKIGWPEFVRYKPFRTPAPLNDATDGQDITAALNAGTFLAKVLETHSKSELGFDDTYPSTEGGKVIPLLVEDGYMKYHLEKTTLPALKDFDYPTPEYRDEVLLQAISKIKGQGIAEVGTVHAPISYDSNPSNTAPFVTPVLFRETGVLSGTVCSAPYDEHPDVMLYDLVQAITLQGTSKPSSIVCTDDLTANLLSDFCKKAKILTALVPKSDDFDQATQQLFNMMFK